jgi:hypothetical protein
MTIKGFGMRRCDRESGSQREMRFGVNAHMRCTWFSGLMHAITVIKAACTV